MKIPEFTDGCGPDHFSRRTLLKMAGMAGLTWLTPLGQILALEAEENRDSRARSVIILWLAGGPSQLETFDPHSDSAIAYGTPAIKTSLKNVKLAAGLERTAAILSEMSLIRSVISLEGDHERATYNIQTGYRPSPTVVHPAIGAIISHELPNPTIEIPTHISILPGQWPARGGYFGAAYDAFKTGDPAKPIPDLSSRIDTKRQQRRLKNLSVIEEAFRQGRQPDLDSAKTLVFLTNNFALPALTITQLYRCRWQVELFFKWIKQHLRIKRFYGTSENAVKTQLWIAVSVYVLVAIIKKELKLNASLHTLLQLLSVTLFEKVS